MNGNSDPTPLADLAATMHEMFTALVAAGFDEDLAARMIVYWFVEANRRQPPAPPPPGV